MSQVGGAPQIAWHLDAEGCWWLPLKIGCKTSGCEFLAPIFFGGGDLYTPHLFPAHQGPHHDTAWCRNQDKFHQGILRCETGTDDSEIRRENQVTALENLKFWQKGVFLTKNWCNCWDPSTVCQPFSHWSGCYWLLLNVVGPSPSATQTKAIAFTTNHSPYRVKKPFDQKFKKRYVSIHPKKKSRSFF